MTTSSHSAVIWTFFIILTTDDKTRVICNYFTEEFRRGGQDKYGFGHSGLKKHLATHPPTNIKYLAEQKAAEKIKITVQAAKNTNKTNQTILEASFLKT
uniref:BED-type domain-containing protein n=1 Tax=Romanomermis culicivorax TaxID=13658 RepID=A0A915L8Q8_ROMCU